MDSSSDYCLSDDEEPSDEELFEPDDDDLPFESLFQKSAVNGISVVSEHPFRIQMPLPFV